MRKPIKTLLAVTLACVTLCLCGCGEKPAQDREEQPAQTIQIPPMMVDLQNPENKAEVPADVPSAVTDAQGNRLSDSQWLLNSKFSKSYIQSLGVGSYSFTYESAQATGTIQLTVTDGEKPNYVFAAEIPQTVAYLDALFLPRLVKEQDSYQGDYEINYQLQCGDADVELLEKPNGFQTEMLQSGDYSWTATLSRDGVAYTYTHSFHVQSFDEYLQDQLNDVLFDEQAKTYLAAEDGKFAVNTAGNNGIYTYTVSQSIMEKAIAAGKTWLTLTVITDKPYAADASGENKGSFWMTDSWNSYNIGCSSLSPFEDDRRGTALSSVVGMYKEDGKYIYHMAADLRMGYFTQATPLQYFFADGIQCQAELTLHFE